MWVGRRIGHVYMRKRGRIGRITIRRVIGEVKTPRWRSE